jgi:hypothetical protein
VPLSVVRARKHVKEQVARLSARRERAMWPPYLYHACDVTTAIGIIRDDQLKCRNTATDFLDVANEGALNIYEGSHSCARLYFRPKNGFHFRTEGIKCIDDRHRLPNHMSIPVMFVFDFVSVITLPTARFSNGNVQRSKVFLDGEAEFDKLDFDAIYHDAPTTQENRDYIHNMRMSEVSVEGKVDLQPHLKAIVFRSHSDMHTFYYLLSLDGLICNYKAFVERGKGALFLSRGFYLNELTFSHGTVSLGFNFPVDFTPHDRKFKLFVQQKADGIVATYDKVVQLKSRTLNISNYLRNPGVWNIKLEDQLAFIGEIRTEISELF